MKTIIYYSGEGHTWSNPECFLGDTANLMLTFHNSYSKKKLDARFRAVLRARQHQHKTSQERDVDVSSISETERGPGH